jgi:hypothetical protein
MSLLCNRGSGSSNGQAFELGLVGAATEYLGADYSGTPIVKITNISTPFTFGIPGSFSIGESFALYEADFSAGYVFMTTRVEYEPGAGEIPEPLTLLTTAAALAWLALRRYGIRA